MWQCKYCKERYVEEPIDHLCVDDSLKDHFRGRRAVIEPLLRALLQRLERLRGITVRSDKSFVVLATTKPFSVIRVAEDHLAVCVRLPAAAPISPNVFSAARLHIPDMTHYFTIHTVRDITPDILKTIMWAKDAAEEVKT